MQVIELEVAHEVQRIDDKCPERCVGRPVDELAGVDQARDRIALELNVAIRKELIHDLDRLPVGDERLDRLSAIGRLDT